MEINILKCCICGFENEKSILAHVRSQHKLSPLQYRKQFNMPLRKCWAQNDPVFFKNLGKSNAEIMRNKPGRAKLHNKWSRKFEKCMECNSTEQKHVSNGLCIKCYSRKKMKERTLYSNFHTMSYGIEGEDYIICQICKKPYKNLTDCGHLKEHKTTSDEYKKLFPNQKMCCKKSTKAKSIGVSNGRKKLMLERGYLNPQSQRDSKRKEMIQKHSNKEFATVSKIEDVVSEWFEKNNYKIYWDVDVDEIPLDKNTIIRQHVFLGRYCVDFACPERKIVLEVLGDWWHGWDFICSNKTFEEQHPKVQRNIKLDELRFKTIVENKWMLIKIWEHDIKNGDFENILKQHFEGQNAI